MLLWRVPLSAVLAAMVCAVCLIAGADRHVAAALGVVIGSTVAMLLVPPR